MKSVLKRGFNLAASAVGSVVLALANGLNLWDLLLLAVVLYFGASYSDKHNGRLYAYAVRSSA